MWEKWGSVTISSGSERFSESKTEAQALYLRSEA